MRVATGQWIKHPPGSKWDFSGGWEPVMHTYEAKAGTIVQIIMTSDQGRVRVTDSAIRMAFASLSGDDLEPVAVRVNPRSQKQT
jgi:hypothetical protein